MQLVRNTPACTQHEGRGAGVVSRQLAGLAASRRHKRCGTPLCLLMSKAMRQYADGGRAIQQAYKKESSAQG